MKKKWRATLDIHRLHLTLSINWLYNGTDQCLEATAIIWTCSHFTTRIEHKRTVGDYDNLLYCHNGRQKHDLFTLVDSEIHSKCNKRSDYWYDSVLLNKRTLAIRIGNDTEIALADIDLDGVNSICTKRNTLEDNLQPFSLSKLKVQKDWRLSAMSASKNSQKLLTHDQ